MDCSRYMTQGAFHPTASPRAVASVTVSEASGIKVEHLCQSFPENSHCLRKIAESKR